MPRPWRMRTILPRPPDQPASVTRPSAGARPRAPPPHVQHRMQAAPAEAGADAAELERGAQELLAHGEALGVEVGVAALGLEANGPEQPLAAHQLGGADGAVAGELAVEGE